MSHRDSNAAREDSVLTSLSELRRIEADRVDEETERVRQDETRRLEAEQAEQRERLREERLLAEEEAERVRQRQVREEAEHREAQLRLQEVERLRRVEAELALERARIVSAPLDGNRGKAPHVWILSGLLAAGLLAGGGLLFQLNSKSAQLVRYNDQVARLDRDTVKVQRRLGEQLELREEQLEQLKRELFVLRQRRAEDQKAADKAAAAMAAKGRPTKKGGNKGRHGGKRTEPKKPPATVPLECLNSADPIGCINRK